MLVRELQGAVVRPMTRRAAAVTRLIVALMVLSAATAVSAQHADWRDGDHDGVHLRVLRDYELPANATAREPIVVIGGSAKINGHAEDDVTVIGGTLHIGPTAVVGGDVVTVGGEAIIDPAAQIAGEINRSVVVGPDIQLGLGWLSTGWWTLLAFGATILRLGIVFVVAVLLTLVAPDWINSIARRASSAPLGSAAIGVAGEILAVPAAVAVTIALVLSVIGILLLVAFPIVLGAAGLLWVAGYAAVAAQVGLRLRGRDAVATKVTILDLFIGFALISALTLMAHGLMIGSGSAGPFLWMLRAAGWFVEWIAWTVGLGAALASVFGGRQPVTP